MEPDKKSPEELAAEKVFPGAAIDAADKDEVTKKDVKEATCVRDFNPHTQGI